MNKNVKDITGQKFGMLTVLSICEERSEKGKCVCWNCICDCGNEIVVSGRELRRRDTKSCGCARKTNMEPGSKYGRLTVVRCYGKDKNGSYQWVCTCDCNPEKEIVVNGSRMRNGITKSCGCLGPIKTRERFYKGEGVSAFNNLIFLYKKQAKSRNFSFELTEEEFRILTKQPCHYCGKEPSQVYKSYNDSGDYIYNGIDRMDSSKGYTKENSVSSCWVCNYAKRAMSVEDFTEWIIRAYNYLTQKG